jgi:ABC-type uncharacterized transport system involved in gliding motility auxiliary subunit
MKLYESQRNLLLGGGAAAGVIIFLAIVVGLQYIAIQYPKRWDLTKTGQYTLAPQSKKIMDQLRQKKIPVEVLGFYETKDVAARESVRDLLDQYRDVDPDLKYSFIDPDRERAVALANKIESYPTLVIKVGKKDERISTADEESVTNAISRLLRTEVKKVYFLKGHGELSPASTEAQGFSVAKQEIEKQNYKTDEIVLMQAAEVPKDATILIIAGPNTDLMDNELEEIRNYLKRGGSLLVMLNPFKTPKLCSFLKDYGFSTADDIVIDQMSRVLGGDYLMPVVTTYVKFAITKNFTVASFFPEARSVSAAKKPGPNLVVQNLALTSPVSWTIDQEQLKSGNAKFDPKTGVKGPLSVMAVSTFTPPAETPKPGAKNTSETGTKADGKKEEAKKNPDEKSDAKTKKARIVVTGSSQLASNKFFKLQGNGDLFMNTVSWLAEDENLIAIRPKSAHSQPLVLQSRDSLMILLIPVALIPLAWIVAGIVVFLYRRRPAGA